MEELKLRYEALDQQFKGNIGNCKYGVVRRDKYFELISFHKVDEQEVVVSTVYNDKTEDYSIKLFIGKYEYSDFFDENGTHVVIYAKVNVSVPREYHKLVGKVIALYKTLDMVWKW